MPATKVLMFLRGYVEDIKARKLRVPQQLKDTVIAFLKVQLLVGGPILA